MIASLFRHASTDHTQALLAQWEEVVDTAFKFAGGGITRELFMQWLLAFASDVLLSSAFSILVVLAIPGSGSLLCLNSYKKNHSVSPLFCCS